MSLTTVICTKELYYSFDLKQKLFPFLFQKYKVLKQHLACKFCAENQILLQSQLKTENKLIKQEGKGANKLKSEMVSVKEETSGVEPTQYEFQFSKEACGMITDELPEQVHKMFTEWLTDE